MNETSGSESPSWVGRAGERWASRTDDVRVYEHYHRYALAVHFVRGKRVLDLTCGEGDGTAVLATEAAEVVGLDPDAATVEHATVHHGSRKVRFHCGSVTNPRALADHKPFDVVVHFGTIEHTGDYGIVLALVRSKLIHGGLFVAGIPVAALDHGKGSNGSPSHGRESPALRFESLLEGSFRHAAVLKQDVAIGSVLTPVDPGDPDTAVDGVRLQTLRQQPSGSWAIEQGIPKTYLLGLASNRPLPKLPAAAVLLDAEPASLCHPSGAGKLLE